jgi:uncharacterized membrane protein
MDIMPHVHSTQRRLLFAFGLLSIVSVGFYLVTSIANHSFMYWYLVWNLFLAWLPLLFITLLYKLLRAYPWSGWQGVGLTLLWLIFLPNSFYIVSDFIHLGDIGQLDVLSDAVMFLLFALSGLMLGFVSLYMVHRLLLKRLSRKSAHVIVAIVLLLCSYAVYLGRDLRWNSWDAVLHPAGVLFDLSDPFLSPGTHHDAFTTTLMFFVLLGTLYVVAWQFGRVMQSGNKLHVPAANTEAHL